ncbi:hypothetical protein VFPBJ_06481 [Purpureocillium lilacinum]|uniref:Uncharacterized protein n=1 Tax=Purpureocillium lilacinum TaxID=33203 RepID=A0A179GLS8_PURLI|nr:hypothetical protein Purlil1_3420 [Purpureocillium lilacinum]OAQ78360.1 hypothetical protein VFPBJ_06481 [Purpureocillium lilacinum]GJN72297.1 hypothetical protein PLICBS_006369 [Purpureocillium lilacinum]
MRFSLLSIAMAALGSFTTAAAAAPLDARGVAVPAEGEWLEASVAQQRREALLESGLESRGLEGPFQTVGTGWTGLQFHHTNFQLNTCYFSPFNYEQQVSFFHNTRSFGPAKGYQCALYSGYNNCADNTKIVDHLAYPGKDNFGDKNAHWGSYYCWKV